MIHLCLTLLILIAIPTSIICQYERSSFGGGGGGQLGDRDDYDRLRGYIQELGHEPESDFSDFSDSGSTREGRILGGSLSPRPLPFLAAVRLKTANMYHYCAGALIDQFHVVTAAHCILPQMQQFPNVLSIRMNVTDIHDDDNAVDIDVAHVERNPNFNPENFYHDVAILTLRSAAPATVGARSESTAIRMPDPGTSYAGRYAAVAGWGVTQAGPPGARNGGRPNARLLHYLIEQVMPQSTCRRVYQGIVNPVFCDCQLCAGGQAQKDACQGDSGAPMWVIEDDGQPTFIGVVSTGTSCGMPGRPGIYTSVGPHMNYIQQHSGEGGGGFGIGGARPRSDEGEEHFDGNSEN